MSRKLFFALFLMPGVALAQNHLQMNQQQMQAMMGQMQEMQRCMQQVDQTRMEALGRRAEQVDKEIKALCAKGERDEAQDAAMAFGQEMLKDPDMKLMRKCTEGLEGMIPSMPHTDSPEDLAARHVCDE
jgi:hypothetical protein